MSRIKTAIGLMSGTSLDGIDIALLRTDGQEHLLIDREKSLELPYDEMDRDQLREALRRAPELRGREDRPDWRQAAEALVTRRHIKAVEAFLDYHDLPAGQIDVIGFHGQTLIHRPQEGFTLQIGDGQALAEALEIPVVADLRLNDMLHGGQGAPLVPVFHAALCRQAGLELPVAIVNIGGVANISWIGAGKPEEGGLIAFDTGPGNALLDDWIYEKTAGRFAFDVDGRFAGAGRADKAALQALRTDSYFAAPPPKSLDRNHFSRGPCCSLSLEDGAATLTAFTAESIALSMRHLPQVPQSWIICGGGAYNPALMEQLERCLPGRVYPADEAGWSSGFMEAQAFAFLAVRSLYGLPLTFPGTTGVSAPVSGGKLHQV